MSPPLARLCWCRMGLQVLLDQVCESLWLYKTSYSCIWVFARTCWTAKTPSIKARAQYHHTLALFCPNWILYMAEFRSQSKSSKPALATLCLTLLEYWICNRLENPLSVPTLRNAKLLAVNNQHVVEPKLPLDILWRIEACTQGHHIQCWLNLCHTECRWEGENLLLMWEKEHVF